MVKGGWRISGLLGSNRKKTQAAARAEPKRGTNHFKSDFQGSQEVGAGLTRSMTRATKRSSAASEKDGWGKRAPEIFSHSPTARRHSGQAERCTSTSTLSFSVRGPS